MELKKIAKRNERREKRVSNDKKRPKVGSIWHLSVRRGFEMSQNHHSNWPNLNHVPDS